MVQSPLTGHIFCHLAKNPIQLQSFLASSIARPPTEKVQSGPIRFFMSVRPSLACRVRFASFHFTQKQKKVSWTEEQKWRHVKCYDFPREKSLTQQNWLSFLSLARVRTKITIGTI